MSERAFGTIGSSMAADSDPSEALDPSGPVASGVGARIGSVVGTGFAVAALAFVFKTLSREWEQAEAQLRAARPGWLLVAVVLAGLAMTSIGVVWGRVLHQLGVAVKATRVVSWYFVGELGKYLPGGVWPVVGRGELARRGGGTGAAALCGGGGQGDALIVRTI